MHVTGRCPVIVGVEHIVCICVFEHRVRVILTLKSMNFLLNADESDIRPGLHTKYNTVESPSDPTVTLLVEVSFVHDHLPKYPTDFCFCHGAILGGRLQL